MRDDAVEERLLGHLLKANDDADQRTVEDALADDPVAIHDLAVLRRGLAPLAAGREEIDPPADLAMRTIARVAQHIVDTEGFSPNPTAGRTESLIRRAAAFAAPGPVAPRVTASESAVTHPPRRRNVFAAIGLSLAAAAIAGPAVVNVRQQERRIACQDSIKTFYTAAAAYRDNNGHLPQVEDDKPATTAADTLKHAGYLSKDARFACPAGEPGASSTISLVNYAYSLGFRDEAGRLQPPPADSLVSTPILADAPRRQGNATRPGNHRHGQNVLYADGHLRFCTTPQVGVDGDDIFYNANGLVAAGVSPADAALGSPYDRP